MINLNKSLISHFLEKEEAAAKYVYKELYRFLFHIGYSYLNNKEDAEDIVNETFVKLLENTGPVPSYPTYFVSYVAKIAKNLSIDLIRKRENESSLELDDNSISSHDSYVSPMLDSIRKILSKEQYDVFMYHAYYGLRFGEIASIVDRSASRCRGIYLEAKELLKQNKEVLRWKKNIKTYLKNTKKK